MAKKKKKRISVIFYHGGMTVDRIVLCWITSYSLPDVITLQKNSGLNIFVKGTRVGQFSPYMTEEKMPFTAVAQCLPPALETTFKQSSLRSKLWPFVGYEYPSWTVQFLPLYKNLL